MKKRENIFERQEFSACMLDKLPTQKMNNENASPKELSESHDFWMSFMFL